MIEEKKFYAIIPRYCLPAIIVIVIAILATVVVALAPPGIELSDGNRINIVRDNRELNTFFDRVSFYYDHEMPYRGNLIEYPALGVAYLTVPAIFSSTEVGYRTGLIIQNSIFLILTVLLAAATLRHFRKNPWLLLFFALPSILYFSLNRYDIWPVFLVQLALLLFIKHRFRWAFIVLSASFLAKGYAVILFPLFMLYYLNAKKIDKFRLLWNRQLLIMVVPTVLFTTFFVIVAGEGGIFPYYFQSTRSFSYGSLYSIYLAELIAIGPDWLVRWGMKLLAITLTMMQYAFPLVLYVGYYHFRKFITNIQHLLLGCGVAISCYMLFSVYYSPQWYLWLLPIVILVVKPGRTLWLLICFDVLNYLTYPIAWNYAGPGSVFFSIFVLLKTAALIAVIVTLVRQLINSQNQALEKKSLATQ